MNAHLTHLETLGLPMTEKLNKVEELTQIVVTPLRVSSQPKKK